ncbi:hypothetical protein TGAMA5MH_03818 [Trichoderma gamsii]|uniref:NAD(P)-binding domain-containing protein n=1 Tax=Trichoderma gamsii TaxID=398673 RepID=A0A2K0TFW9_9HYPO|nr:hypothetical protein TGAMA5MH_03818 [Trichoderma gamsii]
MMTPIKVAVAGASGALGSLIVDCLLNSQSPRFHVTALSRKKHDSATISPQLHVCETDYNDVGKLTDLLRGHDILISAVSADSAIEVDYRLLDSAILAGVSRFIPSEYTLDLYHPAVRATKSPIIYGKKIKRAERLEEEGRNGRIEWTTIVPAGFFDWALDNGLLGFDIKNRKATLYDEGKHLATACTLSFLAACIVRAASLTGPEVRNKRVRVAEFAYTGKEVLDLLEKFTGDKFAVEYVKTADLVSRADEEIAKGNIRAAVVCYAHKHGNDGQGAAYLEDGLLWGQDELSRKTVFQIVEEAVKRSQA